MTKIDIYAININIHSVYAIMEFEMKFLSGFMFGGGFGAAAVNLTIVPYGHNQGFFVGAAMIIAGGVIGAIGSQHRHG